MDVHEGLIEEQDPIQALYMLGMEVTPEAVQGAINYLDPELPTSLQDAEVVLGFASLGAQLHSTTEEWSEVLSRAEKVYQNRLYRSGSQNS